VGKTEIARRLAQLAKAPFVKVEATKFTEVGYVGRDVESMIRDLAAAAVRLVEREKHEELLPIAEKAALESLADRLDDLCYFEDDSSSDSVGSMFEQEDSGDQDVALEDEFEAASRRRAALLSEIQGGVHDKRMVTVDVEEAGSSFLQVFTPGGMEEMGIDSNLMNSFPKRTASRRVTVEEARPILLQEHLKRLSDRAGIHQEALERAEQLGIVFIDEIDKVAGKSGGSGPDVSREGVQRDLLPVIEGSTVATKFGPLKTDHILFIAAGAFHISKPSDLIPELQGRLPIRVELEALSEGDFRRILWEPKNALTKQYQQLLAADGVSIRFTDDALDALAKFAVEVNAKTENIGARRLHTVLEKLLEDVLFEAPEIERKSIEFDAAAVEKKLAPYVHNREALQNIL
jgi:ATP-dependent HslUV protease ATP-binding subunit HslU